MTAILIVEDDADCRDVLVSLANEEGYEAVAARGAREALEILKRPPLPRLILLDLRMPGMSGADFLVEKSRAPALRSIPTVVFSGDEPPDLATEPFVSAGVVGRLMKPVQAPELIATLARHGR